MRESYNPLFAVASLALLAAAVPFASAANAGVPAGGDSSPKYTVNKRTYLWLLPRFWMNGEKSFAYIRIENPLQHPISVYLHCRSSERSLPGMTGRYTLGPGQVKTVDSRKYGRGGQAVLVHCSLKSHDRAKVQHLIRDNRARHFGNRWKLIRPETS